MSLASHWIEHTGESIGASATAADDLPFGQKSPLKLRKTPHRADFWELKNAYLRAKSEVCTQTGLRDPQIEV